MPSRKRSAQDRELNPSYHGDSLAVPGYRHVKGRSYRDAKGHFVKYTEVAQAKLRLLAEEPTRRQALFQQRVQESRLKHEVEKAYRMQHDYRRHERDYNLGAVPMYDFVRDEWLQEFAATPRSQRSKADWTRFRTYMTEIYGDDRRDWGDYD